MSKKLHPAEDDLLAICASDFEILGSVDNCPTSPIFPTSCGLTAGPMDAAVKPRHVGGGGKCQHTLDDSLRDFLEEETQDHFNARKQVEDIVERRALLKELNDLIDDW